MNKIVEAFLKGEKVREKRWNKGDFEQRKVFFKTTPYHPKLWELPEFSHAYKIIELEDWKWVVNQ